MELYLREVESDVNDIAKRIKEIDNNYFIVYNLKKHRYEVHNKLQKDNTLALVVPYSKLDARAINLTNKTKIENKNKLLKEMDKHNQKLGYFE